MVYPALLGPTGLIFGSSLASLLSYHSGFDLLLSILLLNYGSDLHLSFTAHFSFDIAFSFLFGGYPYTRCREVVIAQIWYHSGPSTIINWTIWDCYVVEVRNQV